MARIRRSPKVGGGKATGFFVIGLHRRFDKIDVLWECEKKGEANDQAKEFRKHLEDYTKIWVERVFETSQDKDKDVDEVTQGLLFDC
jgi:hypothetical protein